VKCTPMVISGRKPSGELKIDVTNHGKKAMKIKVTDDKYTKKQMPLSVKAGASKSLTVDTAPAHGWYDFSVVVEGASDVTARYAGRVETGVDSITDPFMGR